MCIQRWWMVDPDIDMDLYIDVHTEIMDGRYI